MMGAFRTDWKGAGKYAAIADALNSIGSCLNNLVGFGVMITRNSRGGYNFSTEGSSLSTDHPFQIWQVENGAASVYVRRGWVMVDGYGADWSGGEEQVLAVPAGTWVVSLKIDKASPLSMTYVLQEDMPPGHSSDSFFIPLATVTCSVVAAEEYQVTIDEQHQWSSILIANYL